MSRIDHVLRMVVRQGGTRLELEAGEQPRLFHGKERLRFFLPPMGGPLLRDMVRPILDPETGDAFDAGEPVQLTYTGHESGTFDIEAQGAEPVRLVLVRQQAAVPTEIPAPVEAATPAPSAAQPAVQAPPAAGASAGAPAPVPLAPSAPVAPPPTLSQAPEVAQPGLERLLSHALSAGASDLHLSDGEPPLMRQHGRLRPLPAAAPVEAVAALLGPLLDGPRQARIAAGSSVDLALNLPGAGRVRGSVFRHRAGLAAAFRVIARAAPRLDALELGVDLAPLVEASHGLVLVCGPTGAGKSTTLAALVRAALEAKGGVLLTLEDPVEYEFDAPPGALVRQRAVGREVADFPTGLRDALRADPDLLLVGEMRDPDTISLALTAAETGHLVFSTLHAGTSASAVERIVDAYPAGRQAQARGQLADALRAVVAQRLVPRRDGDGRVAAVEVLRNTHAVSGLIREGRTAQIAHALQTGAEAGMRPIARALADRVHAGQITREAARRQVEDTASLDQYLRH